MENNRRGTSSENDEVAASGDDLVSNNDIVVEGDDGDTTDALSSSYGDLVKDVAKAAEEAEDVVDKNDVKTLVSLMRDGKISYMVLRRLFAKYILEDLHLSDNFIKLADALTEWEEMSGIPSYSLSEELTNKNWARYYSVLKKAELKLKDKTVEDIALMIEEGELHKSVIENLLKEYDDNREAPDESFVKKIRLATDIAVDEVKK
jgi:phosphate uptake regulator